MDWANERYVRVYTRDTVSWKLCDWRAHTVLLHLFRKVDRAGVLDVGGDGAAGLAAVLELPIEIVDPGIEQLTRVTPGRMSTVEFTGSAYVIPNFIEAQETPQSDPQRTRESRARRRDLASMSRNVTGETRNVSGASRGDTPSHAVSHGVTPSQTSQTSQAKEREASPSPALFELTTKVDRAADVRAEVDELAAVAVAEFNRLLGSKYKATSTAILSDCKALVRAKRTAGQVRAVIALKAKEWMGDPKMGGQFKPSVVLRPSNFARYLDDLEAGNSNIARSPGQQPYQQSSDRAVAVSPLMLAFAMEGAS